MKTDTKMITNVLLVQNFLLFGQIWYSEKAGVMQIASWTTLLAQAIVWSWRHQINRRSFFLYCCDH